jgi:hypothetical protein
MYETETGFEVGELGGMPEFGEFGAAGEVGAAGEFGAAAGEFGEFAELAEYESPEVQEATQFLERMLGGLSSETTSPLSEADEMQLASELLEITSEEELEQFLGNLFRTVGRAVGNFVRGPVGRALGGVLKSVARTALPIVGGALGSIVAPGVGTALGGKLGSMASRLFEVELEAMPQEEAEYEVARRIVGLSAAAARNAAMARPGPGVTPQMLARGAVAQAARRYAPGMYRSMLRSLSTSVPGRPTVSAYRRPTGPVTPGAAVYPPTYAAPPSYPTAWAPDGGTYPIEAPVAERSVPGVSGRWVRRGRRIVLFGV